MGKISVPFFPSAYAYAPLFFAAWVLAWWLLKNFLVRRFKTWAARAAWPWAHPVVDSVSFPINFVIVASGLFILTDVLLLPQEWHPSAVMALQVSVVFGLVTFFDGLARNLIDYFYRAKSAGRVSGGLAKALARGFIVGLGLLIFLDLIGISITPVLASLGIGSVAVALALQDTLSNFFAGVYVTVDKPIRVGDYIRLESGSEGYVIDVGWRTTRIRTPQNNVVVLPNSKLVTSLVTNFYLPDKEVVLPLEVGVHYASDLKRVEEVALEVAKEILSRVPGAAAEASPQVRFHAFGDSNVQCTVVLRIREISDDGLVRHEFIKALHERFRRERIVIAYPTRTLEFSGRLPGFVKSGEPS